MRLPRRASVALLKLASVVASAALVVACGGASAPSSPPSLPQLVIVEVPPPIDELCGDGCVRASQCAPQRTEEERLVIAENCFLRCRPHHPQHALQTRWTEAIAQCVPLASCSEYVSCLYGRAPTFRGEP